MNQFYVVDVNKRYFYFIVDIYKVRAVRSSGKISEIIANRTKNTNDLDLIPVDLYNEMQLYARQVAEELTRPARR